MFLITTADERTWRRDGKILFLGEWCRLYERQTVWSGMDAQVVPYHWDDRKKLHRDHSYLQGLYEQLLQGLAEKLNDIHGQDHTLRYWRILIGPWLCLFIETLFDRWEMVQRAAADYAITGVRILEKSKGSTVPNDMAHFYQLCSQDMWNEEIYGSLLQDWTTLPVEKVPCAAQDEMQRKPLAGPPAQGAKDQLVRKASAILQMCAREDEAFLITTYLPAVQDFRLQWRLGQLSKFWRSMPAPQVSVDLSQRHWQLGQMGSEGFPAVVRAMIPRYIPALYLEGYRELQQFCCNLPWPKKPRLIFTSNSFFTDDVFKAWAAEKVEEGTPLVVGQHGGNYGMGLWESSEEHQCEISDRWLSWGWMDENRPNIQPVCNLKMVGRNLSWDPSGHALMIGMTIPRYSYRMFSVPVAGQWLAYFEDQCRFVDALPGPVRSKLLVRLQQQDYDWCQKKRWEERCPDILLDNGQGDITPLIKGSRICISTSNATTFLESMAMNIPTIIFWDPQWYELRNSAVPYFERLKEVGIFHITPESAAQQVLQVWDDVALWWHSKPVQAAREEFCHRYSRISAHSMKDLVESLRQVTQESDEGCNN